LEAVFGEEPVMGWIFSGEVHGQGFAGDACRAALEWADANLQPTPIWAIIAPENLPSIKLADRLGF
jgi:RimJ/RimL family protein N-acetyltransferase